MDLPAFLTSQPLGLFKTKKPPNLIRGKDLERVCSAKLNVSSYAVRVYDKDKKDCVWHEIIFQKFQRFPLKASINTV
jgi:hypothetical protein